MSGIDDAINTIINSILQAVNLDLNKIAREILEALGFPEVNFPTFGNPFKDIELPSVALPDLGINDMIQNVMDIPNQLQDKVLDAAPPLFRDAFETCATEPDQMMCLTNEVAGALPGVGGVVSQMNDLAGAFSRIQQSLQSKLEEMLSMIALPKCINETTVPVDVADIVREKIGIDLPDDVCSFEIPMCTEYEAFDLSSLTDELDGALESLMDEMEPFVEEVTAAMEIPINVSSTRDFAQ